MGIRAGQLRHRVTIERYEAGGRDDDGFELPSQWVEHRKLWSKITPLSSKDLIGAQAELSEVTARIMVRYNTEIDTTMRVIWKGRVFAIDSQGLDDNENSYIYTTFNLSGGVERFKNHLPDIVNNLWGTSDPKPSLTSLEKLVNKDLPDAMGDDYV